MAGRASLWEHPLVSSVAFHPRRCAPNTRHDPSRGGWIDNAIAIGDGIQIAYRIYVAPPRSEEPDAPPDRRPVLWYQHANAELCTDMQGEEGLFYECGFRAVLCPEFRGFAWSTGKPSLTKLCPDAEIAFQAIPEILADAGIQDAPIIVAGRSLGAACAVHIAATFPEHVAGLILESGCMSLLALPMVQEMGRMMPDMIQALGQSSEPPNAMEKIRKVTSPALFLHGDQDEIVPVEQAIAAHRTCGSTNKKLVRFRRSGHNDVRSTARSQYRTELSLMAQIASGTCPPEALLLQPPPSPGIFSLGLGFLRKSLRCVPGMNRCLSGQEHEDCSVEVRQPDSEEAPSSEEAVPADTKTETSRGSAYTILMPSAGWSKAKNYLDDLKSMREAPSQNLVKLIGSKDFNFSYIDLVKHLLQTKVPRIFAESAVRGDGSDWNLKELSILGDISFAVPVRIFDNGAHVAPEVHPEPFEGTLLYTCGALLRPDNTSADWQELVKDLTLDQQAYFELYERRLFPCFQYANDSAEKACRRAFITIPGLGCGQFAGRFVGTLGEKLSVVLQRILEKHGSRWPCIHVVYFDAFRECVPRREVIEGTEINYIVQPLGKSGSNGRCQLCRPKDYEGAVGAEDDDFSECDLFSFVAWDHVSWPGNDYWAGDRATDDGVKAAATDSMYRLSGVEGSYDTHRNQYMPPETYTSWGALLKEKDISLDVSRLRE